MGMIGWWASSAKMLLANQFCINPSCWLLLLPSFLVCIFAFMLWFRNSRTSASAKLPPGPLSLPIIGHLHLLGKLPHQSLQNLSRTHGPLISLRLGSVPTIVASSADMAREILQTHDLNFASRPRTAAAVYCLFDCTDIGFAPYGPYWRLMRQLCVTDLFTNRRLDGFRPMREEEMVLLVRSVYTNSKLGNEVPVLERLGNTANNIICRMTLGKKFTDLCSRFQDPSTNIVKLMSEMLYLIGVFNVGDFLPYLQWMDLQGYVNRMKSVRESLSYILQELIDARREQRKVDSSSPKDLLDVLLSAAENNQQSEVTITDDNIKAVLTDMFSAGTDSTSVTTEWALTELLRKPTIMKKIQDELEGVVGRERLVKEQDIPQLPYLQAVVKETMRLHPIAPLMIPHESIHPCEVAGYHIPAKTRAFVNVWAIARDPKEWELPTEFWPERFLGSNVDVRGKHFQLLPFGTGRRGCPGWALGLSNVQLMLASLLHGFDWELPRMENGCKMEVDMSEKVGITLVKATPLLAMATPRLTPSLYHSTP